MEKELFSNSQIHDLGIIDSQEDTARSNLAHLPKDVLRSGTIESLISQNEDLMARLKITMRRFAQVEEENYKLAAESRETKTHFTSLTDQVLILKEKDELWKKRTLRAEEELEKIKSQIKLREIEFAEMRGELLSQKQDLENRKKELENEVLRLRRYRSKVQATVRPMIDQNETQILRLEKQLNAAQVKIEGLEGQINTITNQNNLLTRNAKIQISALEEEKRHLISSFEKDRDDLKLEMQGLHDLNVELRKKVALLDRTLDRQDYLENRVVVLERSKEELKEKHDKDIQDIQGHLVEWRKRAHEAEAHNTNLSAKVQEVENRSQNFQELANRLQVQLDGLRTIWTETSTEVERLRAANMSLEKLNAELCAKLNESRNTPFVENK